MPVSVSADGFSIVTTKSEGKAIATIPDICKIPSPNGSIPLPFPNIAESKDLTGGSIMSKINGGSVAVIGSYISKSTGDEAGVLGGIISGGTRGKAIFMNCSQTVIVEGRPVCRKSDLMIMNDINTISMTGMMQDDVGDSSEVIDQGETRKVTIELELDLKEKMKLPYKLKVTGSQPVEDTIGDSKTLELEVPKQAKKGVLIIGEGENKMKFEIKFPEESEGEPTEQENLHQLGISPGAIDGRIGPKTSQAIKRFQEANDLPQTGELDSTTKNKLKSMAG